MNVRAQSKRLWLAGGATLAVVTVLIGWFGVIQPELAAAATTREQVVSAHLQNTLLEAKNGTLKAQNDATALRAGLANALAQLPSSSGLPEFTRQLSAHATTTSVVLNSVIVGTAAPVEESGTTTDSGPSAGSGTSGDAGTAADAETTSSSNTSTGALVQMTITVSAVGLGGDLQAFLREIQLTGPRRALVSDSQITPSADSSGGIDGPCTLTLTLGIFSAPLSPADQAALEKLLSGT